MIQIGTYLFIINKMTKNNNKNKDKLNIRIKIYKIKILIFKKKLILMTFQRIFNNIY